MSDIPVQDKPDVRNVVTEDDEPVDNLYSEKQERLLTEPLYSSWDGPGEGREFLVAANVGVFPQVGQHPIVPDVFLSLDVKPAPDWKAKEHRSYFVWEFGKPPELVLEIVSNREGREDEEKKRRCARIRVAYYVIYDPLLQIMPDVLTVYRLRGSVYERQDLAEFPDLGLGLMLWDGEFEGVTDTWLRWADPRGVPIPTGGEQRRRADEQRQRADEERRRADEERRRAERLAELLRRSGIDPESA